jgi:O-antigen/teichoic acid export membrane protein
MVVKKFLSNLSYLVLLNLLVKATWVWGIDRTVQVVVGEAVYGLYFAVFNLTLIFQILMDMGIQHFNNITVSGNRSKLVEMLPTIMGLKVILSLFFFSGLFLTAYLIGWRSAEFELLLPVGLNIWFLTFVLYFRSSLTALELFRVDAWISVLDRLIVILLAGSILLFRPFGTEINIMQFIYAQTIGLGLSALISGIIVSSRAKVFVMRFNGGKMRELIRKSFPFALSIILMGAYSRIDSIMVERMLTDGAAEAGIYAAGYRLLDMSNMLGFMFATILLPMFAGLIAKGESAAKLYGVSLRLLGVVAGMLVVFCLASGEGLMKFLYPPSISYWTEVFRLLIIGFIPYSLIYISSTYMMATSRVRLLNTFYLLGFVANLLLNFLLIPDFGAAGAAIATLGTQSFIAVCIIASSGWGRDSELKLNQLLLLALFTAICVSTGILSLQLDFYWLTKGIGASLICLFVALIFKVISLRDLELVLQSKDQRTP